MKLENHPTVAAARKRVSLPQAGPLDAGWLRRLALEAGADDVGFVSIDRPELDDQREHVLSAFPRTRTLVSIVCRMNREAVRSPARSASNQEFHATTDHANDVARELVRRLEAEGVRAMNPAAGFPMEMANYPGRIWTVSHKPVAVAAGLGHMGVHRNVIHPRFGNFIILATALLAAEVSAQGAPIDYNPCLECKLCVSACPVGAIKPDGRFDFSACANHNYREFMAGFTDWVEKVAESGSAQGYRQRVSDSESASMWQSLSFGANYKAAYCLAVCPAGEDVIGPFLDDRKGFVDEFVRPLQKKEETLYVVPNTDAEEHARRRFPHKKIKHVGGLRPASVRSFLMGLPHFFQPGQAGGLKARYHFTFTGEEQAQATVVIAEGRIEAQEGLHGEADCAVTADSATWVGFLRKEKSIVWAVLWGTVRVKGPTSLLTEFGKCFPM